MKIPARNCGELWLSNGSSPERGIRNSSINCARRPEVGPREEEEVGDESGGRATVGDGDSVGSAGGGGVLEGGSTGGSNGLEGAKGAGLLQSSQVSITNGSTMAAMDSNATTKRPKTRHRCLDCATLGSRVGSPSLIIVFYHRGSKRLLFAAVQIYKGVFRSRLVR
jgi:hypothetical protein